MLAWIAQINSALTGLFRLLFLPFGGGSPFWPLAAVSLLTGLLMLWVFAKVSDQAGILRTKERIRGNLLGVRLYQHDVGVVLRLQGVILGDTLRYLGHSLRPLWVLAIPLLLILVQLNLFFGLKPLEVGGRALLTARFTAPERLADTIEIAPSDAFHIETAGIRSAGSAEVSWRLQVDRPGRHQVRLTIGGREIDKQLVAGNGWGEVSGGRTARWLDQLLYSGEPPLPAESGLESIRINYVPQEVDCLGWHLSWLVLFFLLSIASAFLLKGLFGVEI